MQALQAQQIQMNSMDSSSVQEEMDSSIIQEEMESSNSSSSSQLQVVDYSDKSFVVYGELTRKYKDILKPMGGRFNKNLTIDGKLASGWVFGLKNKEKIMNFVMSVNQGTMNSNNGIPSVPSTSNIGLPVVAPPVPVPTNTSTYQFVKFKVYCPRENQSVRLNTGGKVVHGVVTKTESHNRDGVTDTVYIDFNGQTSLGVICRSKWQIFGYFTDHSVFFTE
jgi:hypothetical protein